jgi:SNF2-related domain/Helicase conserved C-terminal domain
MPFVIPDKKALVLNLRYPEKVTACIPKFQYLNSEGVQYLAVPHTIDTYHVLKNLGIGAVVGYEPMRYYYTYPKLSGRFDPMKHQVETAVFCTANKRAFILNEMRTGKSAAVLWAGDYLSKQKQVNKTLILSTMSCMDRVWRQAIFNLFPHKSVAILHGSADRRLALLKENFDYYILNHDGIKVGFGGKRGKSFHAELVAMATSGEINLIIMDEGSEFRNARTEKWKALKALSVKVNRIWWLTGTPTPGGPEDAWAQCKIVNPDSVPTFFTAWKDKVMFNVSPYISIPRHGHEKMVHEAMQPAVRYKKADVLDMMPVTYDDREAVMSVEQEKAYKEIKNQGVVQSNQGSITAVNAAVLLLKMLQIAAGAVKTTEEGGLMHYPSPARLAVLDELIEQAGSKVIVFAPYKAVVDLLVQHIAKKWEVAHIDGRVTGKKRDDVIRAFQDGNTLKVLVAHPKTTGHGLELSAADTVIWYAPMHSVDLYEQANNRIMSGLQKRNMGVYHIGCCPLEWKIYKALKAGVSMQQQVLKLYEEEVLGKN